MDMGTVLGVALAATIGGGVVWWIMSLRERPDSRVTQQVAPSTGLMALNSSGANDQENRSILLRQSSSLVIENDQGARALAVTELPHALFDKVAGKSTRPTKSIGRLNALLQAVPATAMAGGMPENIYEVAINGPLINARDAAGNLIEGGFRAMSKGANGRFTEHAVLSNPGSLSQAMNAAAVWQIASVVVAQKHLADISQKLDRLETGMGRIDGKIDAKRQGTLMGAIEHLREISGSILTGDYNATLRQSLEDHAKELLALRHEVAIILDKRIDALPDIKDPDTINADGFADLIRDEMDAIAIHFREWLLCSHARFQSWSLLTAMPGEDALKQERYRQIVMDLEKMKGPDSPVHTFAKNIRQMINRVHARVWSASALAELREQLLESLDAISDELEADFETEWKLVMEGGELLNDISQPTRILVKARGGEILAMKHLPANEAPMMLEHQLQPSVFHPDLLQALEYDQVAVDGNRRLGAATS